MSLIDFLTTLITVMLFANAITALIAFIKTDDDDKYTVGASFLSSVATLLATMIIVFYLSSFAEGVRHYERLPNSDGTITWQIVVTPKQ